MRRSGPPRRRVPLERAGTGLDRHALPRKPLQRSRRPRSRAGAESWKRRARARFAGRCAVTGRRGRHPVHHVVPAQHLRRAGIDPYADPRNGLPVTWRVHERHELAVERIPRACIPQDAIDFAEEHGFGWLIDRYYSDSPAAGSSRTIDP